MNTLHALSVLLPELSISRADGVIFPEELVSPTKEEVKDAREYLVTQIRKNITDKSRLRRLLSKTFFISLGKACRIVDDMYVSLSDENINDLVEVCDGVTSAGIDANDEALRLYSRGHFAAARQQLWNLSTQNSDQSPGKYQYPNLFNFKLCQWRHGELFPSEVIDSVEYEVSCGSISENAGAKFIEEISFEGGHFPADIWNYHDRTVYLSKSVSFVSITSLSSVSLSECLIGMGNAFSILSPNPRTLGLSEAVYFHSTLNALQSSNKRIWYARADDLEVHIILSSHSLLFHAF